MHQMPVPGVLDDRFLRSLQASVVSLADMNLPLPSSAPEQHPCSLILCQGQAPGACSPSAERGWGPLGHPRDGRLGRAAEGSYCRVASKRGQTLSGGAISVQVQRREKWVTCQKDGCAPERD